MYIGIMFSDDKIKRMISTENGSNRYNRKVEIFQIPN